MYHLWHNAYFHMNNVFSSNSHIINFEACVLVYQLKQNIFVHVLLEHYFSYILHYICQNWPSFPHLHFLNVIINTVLLLAIFLLTTGRETKTILRFCVFRVIKITWWLVRTPALILAAKSSVILFRWLFLVRN